jgi:hypothetical protein
MDQTKSMFYQVNETWLFPFSFCLPLLLPGFSRTALPQNFMNTNFLSQAVFSGKSNKGIFCMHFEGKSYEIGWWFSSEK